MLNLNGWRAKQLLVIALAALCLTACGAIGNLVKSSDSSAANRSLASTTSRTNTEAENYAAPKSAGGMNISRFSQAQNNLHDAASYHFNLTTDALPGSANPAKHSVADGVYDAKKKHSFQYTVTTDGKPAQEWLIQAGSGGENYTKRDGAWTLVPGITDQSSLSVDIVIAAAGMSSLKMNKDGSPNLVGTETVAGETCEHYHFDNRESAKSVADVYISQATGNFVRFDLDDSNNKFQLLIDKIGEPVNVDTPQ